jgi:hypothetical protein
LGSVTSAKAVSGPATLRGEAERAARGWRFRPFSEGGSARAVTGDIPFRFAL